MCYLSQSQIWLSNWTELALGADWQVQGVTICTRENLLGLGFWTPGWCLVGLGPHQLGHSEYFHVIPDFRNYGNIGCLKGFPCGSAGKESVCNVGDLGLIPGLGRSPGERKGYPLQYSGLENSMDSIVHGVTELDMTEWLSLTHSLGCLKSTQGVLSHHKVSLNPSPHSKLTFPVRWPCVHVYVTHPKATGSRLRWVRYWIYKQNLNNFMFVKSPCKCTPLNKKQNQKLLLHLLFLIING